jgi:DNA-directed RNA polymerase subunit RPC12/RpoP
MQQDSVHQCPYCELRFLLANEVKDHILHDHPDHEHVADSAHPVELPKG